jgi:hypothetical protein
MAERQGRAGGEVGLELAPLQPPPSVQVVNLIIDAPDAKIPVSIKAILIEAVPIEFP